MRFAVALAAVSAVPALAAPGFQGWGEQEAKKPADNSWMNFGNFGKWASAWEKAAEEHKPQPYKAENHGFSSRSKVYVTSVIKTTITTCLSGETITTSGTTTVLSTSSIITSTYTETDTVTSSVVPGSTASSSVASATPASSSSTIIGPVSGSSSGSLVSYPGTSASASSASPIPTSGFPSYDSSSILTSMASEASSSSSGPVVVSPVTESTSSSTGLPTYSGSVYEPSTVSGSSLDSTSLPSSASQSSSSPVSPVGPTSSGASATESSSSSSVTVSDSASDSLPAYSGSVYQPTSASSSGSASESSTYPAGPVTESSSSSSATESSSTVTTPADSTSTITIPVGSTTTVVSTVYTTTATSVISGSTSTYITTAVVSTTTCITVPVTVSSSDAPYGNGTTSVPSYPTGTGAYADSSSVSSSASSSTVSSASTYPVGPISTGSSSSASASASSSSTLPSYPIGTGGYGTGSSSSSLSSSLSSTYPVGPISTGSSSFSSESSSSLPTYSGPVYPTAPVGTGSSSTVDSSSSVPAPYENQTSSSTVPSYPGTGVYTVISSTSSLPSYPTGTGGYGTDSSSSASSVNYNSTSFTYVGPTGTGSTVTLSISSSSSSTSSFGYNGTTSSVPVGPTAPVTTSSSTSVGYNGTSSTTVGPTAPLTTSTASLNSTTSSNATITSTSSAAPLFPSPGLSPNHTVVTNTTLCSVKPTATAACVPCEGQGSGQYCGFDVNTNSYENTPITCNVVPVQLDLTECTVSPDGIERTALCVNGQTPGPLIEANWGDILQITVTNSMSLNGTSVHWHGFRQLNSNEMDGVVSVTQCALAPGESMTYTFRAENYGFSWYHSHLSLQTYEGIFGPIIIHGPHSATYDVELDPVIVQDWSHIPVDAMYRDAEINGVRTMDNGLINGKNTWGADGTANQTGVRYTVPTDFEPGKKYLIRLLNGAIQSTYKFYIDGHKFQVISADFVPIVPYETDILNINIGQRYEIVVTADQTPGSYWMRFDNQNACASTIQSYDIKAIINYSGYSGSPNSTAYDYDRKYLGDTAVGYCVDENSTNLVPIAPMTVGASSQQIEHTVIVSNSNPINLYRWYLDGTTFQTNWADATLYDIVNNGTVPDYSGNLAIEVPNLGEWVYIIIESPVPLGHPIHLHGHDFFVLAHGYGTYEAANPTLNLNNPPRRDVAFLPGDGPTGQGGYLVLAFYTDNPGAWLMHCHIGWHVSMGFALQIIEGQEYIKGNVSDTCMLDDTCATWRKWADNHDLSTDDSGV
ncbi:hypothetical protein H2203_008101 [Taxawa tesnikishii (nom. ined.)]|nr:hypothetical protein H2203_008101 [Dothideales sp. JES 119]